MGPIISNNDELHQQQTTIDLFSSHVNVSPQVSRHIFYDRPVY
jgi:hypothetical protein